MFHMFCDFILYDTCDTCIHKQIKCMKLGLSFYSTHVFDKHTSLLCNWSESVAVHHFCFFPHKIVRLFWIVYFVVCVGSPGRKMCFFPVSFNTSKVVMVVLELLCWIKLFFPNFIVRKLTLNWVACNVLTVVFCYIS